MLFKTKSMIRNYARWAFIVILLVIPLALLSFLMVPEFIAPDDRILYVLTVVAFFLIGAGLLHFAFWEKFFAYLTITNDGILWKCPFRKSRFIKKEDCKYIGVDAEQPGDYVEIFPILYFSTEPYPEKYKGKIAKIKCSDTFIKFWYLDALADYLLENFPREKTYIIAGFKRRQKMPFE